MNQNKARKQSCNSLPPSLHFQGMSPSQRYTAEYLATTMTPQRDLPVDEPSPAGSSSASKPLPPLMHNPLSYLA